MIAASKMNRAQNMVRDGRPYADRIREVLGDLAALATEEDDTPVSVSEVRLRRRVRRALQAQMLKESRGAGLFGAIGFDGDVRQFIANGYSHDQVPLGCR